jgi:TP901 family phage tail tape measure protein|nr:MAG TPA: minor tail protein [Caudoviricetes sp.]
MADSPYRVGYDIGAKVDYSQIKDATKAAGELINKLQKVQDLQKGRTAGSTGDSMKSAMRSTAQETQNVTNKAKTAAEAQAKLADQMKKTANSGKSMKSTAETIQTVGNHSKTAAGQVNILQRSITKVKNVGTQSFKAISDHVRRFGETSEATRKKLDRLNETGKKFRDVGYNMLPTSVAVGAAFVQGAKDATKLQHRYTIIRNLIKTGGESTVASVKNTKKMMSQGRDMSLKYGISQESIAKGYESLVRRGYQSNQALAAQKTYLQGSIASGDKYSDVITTAASAVESFGLKSKNTAKMTENTKLAVNQMAYAADLTATSFSDLGEAMKFAGPDAHSANQTLGMTSAAIGELSNSHIEGSQAGTSLRQIYQRLINPPQKGKAPKALDQLGLSSKDFLDAKKNLLPIDQIFQKLNDHMKGMTSTQRGGIYAALFGANASSAANVLGSHVKDLKELNKQVAKAQKQGKDGYVGELSKKNMDSWQNRFKQFKASVDDLGMSFAKSVLPSVIPVVKNITQLVKQFGQLPEPVKKTVAYATAFVGIVGPLAVGIGSIASAVATIGKGVARISPLLTAGGVLSKSSRTARTAANSGKVSKVSPLSIVGQFAGDTTGSSLENDAKKSGKEFAKTASGGITKGSKTGSKKFDSTVKKGTTTAGETGGKKFGSRVKSSGTAAGNTGGKRFSYHVKNGAISGGTSGGKRFGNYVQRAAVNGGTSGGARFSNKVRGLGWASLGVAVGAAALKHGKAGEAAGTGIGAGIGGYLLGPEGAAIGAYIGGKIGKYYDAAVKKMKVNIKDYEKKNGKGSFKKLYSGNSDAANPKVAKDAKSGASLRKKLNKLDPSRAGYASGGLISKKQTALVGEGGPELAYTVNGRKARLLGAAGPYFAQVKPGERILNAHDTARVMNGGLGHVLPGYATGTTSLGTQKADKSVDKFSKQSKTAWSKTEKDTSKSTKKINKNTVGDYDTMQKNSAKQLTQLKGANSSTWKSIYSNTRKRTTALRKSTVTDFNSLQQGSQKQMNQLESGIIAAAKATAIGFGKEMGRMKGYAHSAMGGAIGQLNQGISGIDSVLGQFGGNHSVIKPIKYAHGSNGQLTENQMAMVNDATAGPRQELIVRNNNVYAPQGKNRVLPLHKGDQVLNGRQSQEFAAMQGIAHYAKGSGVSKSGLRKIADTNSSHPTKAFNNEYNVHIDLGGSTLQKGSTALGKNSSNKLGPAWSKAMWGVIQDAISDSGSAAGGNWRHSPGAGFHVTSGFGYRGATAGGMADHDGNDFSGAKTVHSVHGGTVIYAGGAPANWGGGNGIGENLVTKGSDGWYVIYQEFNGKNNSGAPMYVHRGDTVKTGQRVAALGPSGTHVHIGVSRHNPFSNSGFTTAGWNDLLKMHGHSSGTPKSRKSDGRLTKLAKAELGKKALKWVGDNLGISNELGSIGGKPVGDLETLIRKAAKAMHATIPGGKWMYYMLHMIQNESGGRAGIKGIDDHDGTGAAMGLLQYKRSTFNSYAVKGHKNILSAWDQLLAFFNNSHYKTDIGIGYNGKVGEWRGRGSGPSGSRRYANGGWAGKASIFGEVAGEPEVAINPKRNTADNLIDQTIEARATADKSSPSADYLNSIKALKVKQSRPKIEPKITLNFNGDISDEKTMNKAVDKFKRGLTDVLTQINDEFGLDDSVW